MSSAFSRTVACLAVLFAVGCEDESPSSHGDPEPPKAIVTPTPTPLTTELPVSPSPSTSPIVTATPTPSISPTPTPTPALLTPLPTPPAPPAVNENEVGLSFGPFDFASDDQVANAAQEQEEAIFPRLAMGPNGVAFAVWRQNTLFSPNSTDPVEYSVWASRFVNGGWESAQLLESPNLPVQMYPPGNATSPGHVTKYIARIPDIAVDSSGNAIAVWHQYNGTGTDIYANRFIPGNGWQGAVHLANVQTVNNESGYGAQARVAMTGNGDAIVVWHQNSGLIWAPTENNGQIATVSYEASTNTWSQPSIISSSTFGQSFSPNIVTNASGNGAIVWTQNGVWVSFYDKSNDQWSTPTSLASGYIENIHLNQRFTEIAMNDNGQVAVTWIQNSQAQVSVYSPSTTSWDAQTLSLPTAGGNAWESAIDMNQQGDIFVTWAEGANPDTSHQVWIAHYRETVPGGGRAWRTSYVVNPNSTQIADLPRIKFGPDGDRALLVWHENRIWAAYYGESSTLPGTYEWYQPQMLEGWISLGWNPQVGFHDDNSALVIWRQHASEDVNATNEILSRSSQ